MNLRDLKADINAVRLHDLAETNVLGVEVDAGHCVLNFDTYQLEADLTEAREERADAEKELKQSESEAEQWERVAREAERIIDDAKDDAPGQLRLARENGDRFRATSIAWAQEVATMRAELQALRKRKGVAAGVCAYSQEVWTLLAYVSQLEGRYKEEARQLCEKIQSVG